MTLAALAGARRANSALDRFVAATATPDLAVDFDFDNHALDPAQASGSIGVFDEAASLPGVTGAEAAAVWVLTPGPELEPWQLGAVTVGPSAHDSYVVSGRLPEPTEPDEVMLNES